MTTLPERIIQDQELEGLYYSRYKKNPTFFLSWKNQWATNQLYLHHFQNICQLAHKQNITIVPLKGVSLFNRIYPDLGERKISDIDLYSPEWEKLVQLLIENDFSLLELNKKTKKAVLSKKSLENIIIEIHGMIFPNEKSSTEISLISSEKMIETKLFSLLSPEFEFVYLCYHFAHQHTFTRLKWAFDLFYFIEKYPNLDFDIIFSVAQNFKIKKSVLLSLAILNKHFCVTFNQKVNKEMSKLTYTIGINFLTNPKKNIFYYLLIKNYTKENIQQILKENLRLVSDYFH